jgi:hypothetical protein
MEDGGVTTPMPNQAGLIIQVTRLAPEAIKAHGLLDKLCARYDLTPFVFTQRIRIEPGGPARPRPVLTLGTGSIGDPPRFLAEFLFQQMQWFLAAREAAAGEAAAALETSFPDFYDQNRELAERPAALFRMVAAAWLELQAMLRFFDAEDVEDALRSHDAARPVYRLVLRHRAAIGKIMELHGLAL